MPYVKMMMSRRDFMKKMGIAGAGLGVAIVAENVLVRQLTAAKKVKAAEIGTSFAAAPVAGGSLNLNKVKKYVRPLNIPGTMPESSPYYYEIAQRQFEQEVVPGLMTTVWGYGSVTDDKSFSYPAKTIEATAGTPVTVKWSNELKNKNGKYLQHLLPIDQTIHWADPAGVHHEMDVPQTPYTGPVPMVPHLHGAHVKQDSDGYPEAWFLPAATNIPVGYDPVGPKWADFAADAAADGRVWGEGFVIYNYPNDQRAATLWFHDHSLGMTRANVYAGPAGFYLIRGGPDDLLPGELPSGAYEIPLVIQDRSFNSDGSLFYPGDRAFFEGLQKSQLQIPFTPDMMSDIAPIWNPEFFGNTSVVNGQTWPYLNVEQKRYRFRLLNACDSRFFILKLSNGDKFWQIGNDGGFLSDPVELETLLIAPAERADVIIDFTNVPIGTQFILENIGPDEPFGGGDPGIDFDMAHPGTTGQVMQFRVVAAMGADNTTSPGSLFLPAITSLAPGAERELSLNELMSMSVFIPVDENGDPVLDKKGNLLAVPGPESDTAAPFGPQSAKLGTLNFDGSGNPIPWNGDITEKPTVGVTEDWIIYNFTADAHPIHLHQIQFEVIERIDQVNGVTTPAEPWETGFKDTVIVYPGDETVEGAGITRVRAKFDIAGLYVWHCHILSHEDNEMMRPIEVQEA